MELSPSELSRRISPSDLDFESTQELPEFTQILGQTRATEALQFGLDMQKPGYHLYVSGETGSGRSRYITDYIKPLAAHGSAPSDWLYVNNFDRPDEPRSLELPHGHGRKFVRDIEKLVEEVIATFPAAFENPSYIQQKNSLQKVFDARYESALLEVEKAASAKSLAVFREEGVMTFSPIIDDKIADDAYFSTMSDDQRETFRFDVEALENLLHDVLVELPQWQRDLNNQLKHLQQKTIQQSLKPLIDDLHQEYQGFTGVMIYLEQMKQHLPKIIQEQLSETGSDNKDQAQKRRLLESTFVPNLISRNENQQGAPLLFALDPSFAHLFGRINAPAFNGESCPSFQLLSGGALHNANGGFLILDIEKLLMDAETWGALKRVLREQKISLDVQSSENAASVPFSINPEPIPLKIKVILIGSRGLYDALCDMDQDFSELFRVLVDFDSDFRCSNNNLNQFAALLHTRAKADNIAELTATAIARLAEYALRLAEHQNRLSTRIDLIMEVISEADYWRQKTDSDLITEVHISTAIVKREYRYALLKDKVTQDILTNQILISTAGKTIAQVNGLAVIQNGELSFGCPLRVTATAHPGSKGVVDIEREVNLGQAVHSKGVLLLSGYLAGRYAKHLSLAISAHIAVEQSYGFIDGDSASLAELCALLSAIIQLPLSQELAVTGSVSQFGEVQAIGGVNDKIEGFFSICKKRHFNGRQGVIIPSANQINLMLSDDVVQAVKRGVFHIYCVNTVDETLALLSGEILDIGMEMNNGLFPTGTVNQRIVSQLTQFAQKAQMTFDD
ncbi:MAG: AAA family ATPase [Pseudomonadales bacterium]|nr:AAA family ATPase [Pseudomonadales bacterium]